MTIEYKGELRRNYQSNVEKNWIINDSFDIFLCRSLRADGPVFFFCGRLFGSDATSFKGLLRGQDWTNHGAATWTPMAGLVWRLRMRAWFEDRDQGPSSGASAGNGSNLLCYSDSGQVQWHVIYPLESACFRTTEGVVIGCRLQLLVIWEVKAVIYSVNPGLRNLAFMNVLARRKAPRVYSLKFGAIVYSVNPGLRTLTFLGSTVR